MAVRERIYLDHNATTPVFPEVAEAMAHALSLANPSSVHSEGRAARAAIEAARVAVAELVGAEPASVIFTSGATEALNAALAGAGAGLRDEGAAPTRLLVAGIEHAAVLSGHGYPERSVSRLAVDANGVIDLGELQLAIRAAAAAGERVLLALQLANNETGVLQPLREAADLVHAAGGLVLSDCVQAAGKMPLSLPMTGADAIALSAHKLGGPKGVGALVLASRALRLGAPLVAGGGQERGQRSGTENVAGIVGFGRAAQVAHARLVQANTLAGLRDRLEHAMSEVAPELVVFGRGADRLANTTCFSLPGLRAETAMIAFDLDGFAVSSGAACSSGKVRRSGVLEAMQTPADLADGAIRVSLGWTNGERDIELFLAAFARRVVAARARMNEKAA